MRTRIVCLVFVILLAAPTVRPSVREFADSIDSVITDLEDARDRLESVADNQDDDENSAEERRSAINEAKFTARTAAAELLLMSANTTDEIARAKAAIKIFLPELEKRRKRPQPKP